MHQSDIEFRLYIRQKTGSLIKSPKKERYKFGSPLKSIEVKCCSGQTAVGFGLVTSLLLM